MSKHIVVIPGDGIGKEITEAAVKVLQKVDEKCGIGLTYEWKDAGGTAYDKVGSPFRKIRLMRRKRLMPFSLVPLAATNGMV